MTWLHTWVGLLVCWVLLLVFFAGTLSYYRYEISLWTQPEVHQDVIQPYQAQKLVQQVDQAQQYLFETAPDAKDWRVYFPTERKPYLSFGWQTQPEEGKRRGKFVQHIVKADGEGVVTDVRESRGGHFFYRLHFDIHYMPAKFARWIVGFCTMFMLLAIISGIVIHKRIFKDFFSFRPSKGSRSWLDAHNVSSVLALPYHLMITYTGLITLMMMYMPWGVMTAYDGDSREFRADFKPHRVSAKPVGSEAQVVALSSLLPQVTSLWGDVPLKSIVVSNLGDKNSQVSFYQNTQQQVTDQRIPLTFSAVTGELLNAEQYASSGAKQTHDTLMALHTARFAEPVLRILFFVCGLMGCAMIATGTLLWAIKIRQKQQKAIKSGQKPSLGLRIVEGLNLTFIAGLPLATCAFFYANRLLPSALANRAQWEINCFFIALAAVALLAVYRRDRQCWRAVLKLSALALMAIPVLNGLTSAQHLLDNLLSQQWTLVGFDLMCVIFGIGLWFAAARLKLPQSQTRRTLRRPNRATNSLGQTAKTEEVS